MKFLRPLFQKEYGTERGFVRHSLALFDYYFGRIEQFKRIEHSKVSRVVFVCLGNICRSAYAHHYAQAHDLGLPISSLGLFTTTGVNANDVAMLAANNRGVNMEHHLATDLKDFEVRAGDLFLVMEVRQANKLSLQLANYKNIQIGLLGNYCKPVHPHLHDPFSLSLEYFDHCFGLIENGVMNLSRELKESLSIANVKLDDQTGAHSGSRYSKDT
ncbi:arsenate reductase/protein-tyrosine-phosphatase family protein [Thalassotalea montiporae]